ncbi:hypothetical protein V6N12_069180 [Hibiscus sabdariffa]|uniref:Uncharacterized protein n=1 Tax=Hibiscus sabdariffa TaxID=183260 RepID=A0ABR2FD93_9ROSI
MRGRVPRNHRKPVIDGRSRPIRVSGCSKVYPSDLVVAVKLFGHYGLNAKWADFTENLATKIALYIDLFGKGWDAKNESRQCLVVGPYKARDGRVQRRISNIFFSLRKLQAWIDLRRGFEVGAVSILVVCALLAGWEFVHNFH